MPLKLSDKLQKLLDQKKELDKKIKKLKEKGTTKLNKKFDEKCRIVGDFFLKQYENKMDELRNKLDPVLKNKKSRKLFGLKENKDN